MFMLHKQLEADCFNLGRLPLCQVLMMNDRQYPWFILVPRRPNVSEIFQLSSADQAALWHESSWFGQMIMDVFNGEKLNIGALGNMVPQLHLHHIVRNQYDASWPAPVWGRLPAKHYSVEDAAKRIGLIEARLLNYRAPEAEFGGLALDDSDFEA
ncbi:hypothetical protein CWE08_05875 [Aliidiomarina iranensis]|uniref:HIT domain-containing protein n=1 Tax=Aliidiomarina iranensis TaxID=1434071 RepID=A0A432VXA1_9GAMM|nr:hypothetical protein CWE08_05875 [Aliidiomarina iranensis]